MGCFDFQFLTKQKLKKQIFSIQKFIEMTEEETSFDPSLKKKKKKKKIGEGDEEKGDKEKDESEDIDLESFGKKKKPKKKKNINLDELKDALDDDNKENEEEEDTTAWANHDRDYTYDELLQRVYDIIKDKNPDSVMGEKKKFVMRPPQVVKVGTKKSAFVNFTEIAKMLHRQPKHLLAFLFAELGTTGNLDGSNQLVMKGKFQQKHIEAVLRRYIKEYVTCHLQISRHHFGQGGTIVFLTVYVMPIQNLGANHQIWFPSCYNQTETYQRETIKT